MPQLKYEEIQKLVRYLDFYYKVNEMNAQEAEKYVSDSHEITVFIDELYHSGFIIVFDWSGWLKQNEKFKNTEDNLDAHIMEADLDTLRMLMTSFIRADRFNEGLFERVIIKGHVTAILLRLKELMEYCFKANNDS